MQHEQSKYDVLMMISNKHEELFAPFAAELRKHGYSVASTDKPVREIRETSLWRSVQLVVPLLEPITDEDLAEAGNLHSIVVPTIGYDFIDVSAATRRGVMVANGASATENATGMAEATIMLILATIYELDRARAMMDGDLARKREARLLAGRKLGIIGFGQIARGIVQRLQGWNVDISVFTRTPPVNSNGNLTFLPLEELLETSDIVVLLSRLNAGSKHLLDRDRLGLMKTGAILINTARGALVEEAALIDAVKSGRISKIALDVFETEPLPLDSELRELENAILTPHCVGHTRDGDAAVVQAVLHNALRMLSGDCPNDCINADGVQSWRYPSSQM